MRLVAGAEVLNLPDPVDASRYYGADEAISNACILDDLGFLLGCELPERTLSALAKIRLEFPHPLAR